MEWSGVGTEGWGGRDRVRRDELGSGFYCPSMSSYLEQSLSKDYTCGLGPHKE